MAADNKHLAEFINEGLYCLGVIDDCIGLRPDDIKVSERTVEETVEYYNGLITFVNENLEAEAVDLPLFTLEEVKNLS